MIAPYPQLAIVTGATQGLGRGIAEALAARGLTVAIAAAKGSEAVAVALGERFIGLDCDVRDADQVATLADRVTAAHGPIDLWVNNAGLALTGASLATLDPSDFQAMTDVNLRGSFHGARAAIRAMGARGGAIWNVHGAGSDGVPVARMNGYATTKRAVQFLTQALAAELEGGPTIVSAISPGLVMTEGFFREHARVAPAERDAREATVNLIGDHVSTLARWAARLMLGRRENGREYPWLRPAKLARRRAMTPPRDILGSYRDADGTVPARPAVR